MRILNICQRVRQDSAIVMEEALNITLYVVSCYYVEIF